MERPGAAGERLVVGRVRAPHGLAGAVRVEVLTDEPSRFRVGSRLFREGDDQPLTVVQSTSSARGATVRFAEVAERSGAEALRGAFLEATASTTRRAGRYLWHEVVGTAVEDRSGTPLGTVRQVFRAGAGEVAVVDGPRGELLIPLVRAFVPCFAPRQGRMVVDGDRLGIDEPAAPDREDRGRRRGRAEAPVLEIDVLTLFPGMLDAPLAESIPGRARERGIVAIRLHDLRRWGLGRHRSVDDYTFGGGAGMVLRPEPVAAALDEVRRPGSAVVLLDPAGERFEQNLARELAAARHLVLVCGRYEGVDERIRSLVDREVSIGDYILSGGEPAAIVVIDALVRLLPAAIEEDSVRDESFAHGLLEYPQYTRPRDFRGQRVPEILVSGDHGAVERWRLKEALRRTRRRRPDLLAARTLTPLEGELLGEIDREVRSSPREGVGRR